MSISQFIKRNSGVSDAELRSLKETIRELIEARAKAMNRGDLDGAKHLTRQLVESFICLGENSNPFPLFVVVSGQYRILTGFNRWGDAEYSECTPANIDKFRDMITDAFLGARNVWEQRGKTTIHRLTREHVQAWRNGGFGNPEALVGAVLYEYSGGVEELPPDPLP